MENLKFKTKVYTVDLLLQLFGNVMSETNYNKLLIWSDLMDDDFKNNL